MIGMSSEDNEEGTSVQVRQRVEQPENNEDGIIHNFC
jgi:hypothetical protein